MTSIMTPPWPGLIEQPGLELSSLRSAELSCDVHQFISLPGGRLALLAGKISEASNSDAPARFAVRLAENLCDAETSTDEALLDFDSMLERLNPQQIFTSLFVAVFDPARQLLLWANRGYPPPLWLSGDGRSLSLENHDQGTDTDECPLTDDDLLAICGENITQKIQRLGDEQLRTLLSEQRNQPLVSITEALATQSDADQPNDVALLLARGKPAMRQMTLTADPENIESVVEAITAEALESGLDQRSATEVALAACEAVTNIIVHALAADPKQSFRVFIGRAINAIIIRFEDQGPPFDPDTVQAVDLNAPLADRPIGGLGWLLIRRHCDEVRMERIANTNILTLVRHQRTTAA